MTAPVCRDYLGEVVADDELGQLVEMLVNNVFNVAIRSARFLLRLSDKPLNHGGESAALGVRAGGEISRELSVEIPCLSACRVDAPIRREIAVHGHDVFLQRDRADQVKEEALSAAVLSNHKSDRRAPVDYPFKIAQQRRHLARARPTWTCWSPRLGTTPAASDWRIASRSRGRVRDSAAIE